MDRVRFRGLLLAVPAFGLLVACQPVPGDPNDISPPAISFSVSDRPVAGGVSLAGLPPTGVRVVASDPGGMTSLHLTNIVVFDCLARGRHEVQSAQLIDIPATQYDELSHVYHGPNGDFWPDADGDGVNEPAEFGLRYDQLLQDVDREYLQSINGVEGQPCTMSNGTAGTSTVRYVLIEALALNFRASILGSDATESFAELVVFVP
jgi:hypothetical protein